MSGSVLFDAPGPKARRLSLIVSIVVGILILAGLYWIYSILAAPRPSSGGVVLPGMFDPSRWDIFSDPEVWTFIGTGVLNTLRAAGAAAVLALVLGVIFALLRTAKTAWIRVPTTVVLEFVRGMPVLLMMLFILLGFSSGAYLAVVLALGLYNGAIIGEALRAGLASLPRGQREAGLSLGMRELQTRMLIEFPQAFRQMLPVIVAQLVVLLKDTSLGFIVGYPELLRATMNNLASFYGNRYLFSLFAVTFVIYLIMNLSLSWVARWLSKHTDSASRGGRGRKGGKPVDVDPAIVIARASASARQQGEGGGV
ncbi:amino acid ABC transporter permease [Mycetocola zhujimingii]|uniref:amino acid ABC transporter permease n=1 Tax=Mycetocola zhujimingii TaxID=2079792 RepID=UPI000D3C9AE3|nr:amino acid ABC transporter permease [Mycetocola zhujimingii]AWB86053.1 polar amino acid ABC transporter permease [Mycetocola zhujimingii]